MFWLFLFWDIAYYFEQSARIPCRMYEQKKIFLIYKFICKFSNLFEVYLSAKFKILFNFLSDMIFWK